MIVTHESPIPLYLQIEDVLRGEINAGRLQPLQQVPSEVALAEQFHVSRMTARRAIEKMVGDGLLFRQPGKGTYVARPKIPHGASQQLSFSSAMRALGLCHSTRVLSAGLARPSSHVAQQLSVGPAEQVIAIRRLRIVEDAPAAIHVSYLPERFKALLDTDLTGSLTELMAGVGAVVVVAEDSLEAIQATGDDAQLLGVGSQAPLIRIEGTAYGHGRVPLRWSEGLYRSDRFRFRIDAAAVRDRFLELK